MIIAKEARDLLNAKLDEKLSWLDKLIKYSINRHKKSVTINSDFLNYCEIEYIRNKGYDVIYKGAFLNTITISW